MNFTDTLSNSNIAYTLNEPMSAHTTFKIGGAADIMITVQSIDELKTALSACKDSDVPFMILGNGSNLLVSDDGIEGAVILLDGDFKAIQDAINSFTRDISDSMHAITEVSATVSDGSTQMAEGSQSLANGTTKQASAIEEISATIQDVSMQIATTADNATQAGELSERTQEKVNYQDAEIQNMLHAMSEINDTSKEIEKIIKTIEDIAFQTNILALNAAVEAARAGAAGKGFAVVADEVRNLANKSQEAAKNTSDLITAAIAAVGKGSEIAGATAESMKEVKEISAQTAKLIVDIAEASQGQSESIKQITAGVEQVSEVIQTNAATAEETSALCSSLSGQSNQLHERVARFELRRD